MLFKGGLVIRLCVAFEGCICDWRKTMKILRCINILLVLLAFALSRAGFATADEKRPLRVVVARGFKIVTMIANNDYNFDKKMIAAFTPDIIEYKPKGREIDLRENNMTRNNLLKTYQHADIYYLAIHGGPIYKGMQSVAVTPSADNKNISPKSKSLAVANEIKKSLVGRTGPALVVLNGCSLTDPNDGAALENRFHTAFGIKDGMKGRAFVGWHRTIVGLAMDRGFADMFVNWTRIGPNGEYPTLKESIDKTRWSGGDSPTIIGDKSLRYSDIKPRPQPKGKKAKIFLVRDYEVNHSVSEKATYWTWHCVIKESNGVGARITEIHNFGWRGAEPQKMSNAVVPVNIYIKGDGSFTRFGHISYTSNKKKNKGKNGKLRAIYYGIDDNGHYFKAQMDTIVVGKGKSAKLEY